MQASFAGHPVIRAIFYLVILLWLALELRQAFRRRPGAQVVDKGSLNVVRLAAVAGIILSILTVRVRATAFSENQVILVAAVSLMLAGIGLRWRCFRTLGHYFTFRVMTSSDQEVIDSGPYHYLRHPSYAGILLILLGLGLTYGNWLSLIALVGLPLAGFINRIRIEEAALLAAKGEAYREYAQGRKRLIPFVW